MTTGRVRMAIGWVLLAITLALAVLVSLYFGIDSVYTQVFFIPIILTGLWSYRKSMYVALLFGLENIFLGLFLNVVGHIPVSMTDQCIRAVMYLLVAAVVGTLSERQARLLGSIKESEEKYRFIAASIDEGIIAVDLEGRITYANPGACRIAGFSPGESLWERTATNLTPATELEIKKLFARAQAGGNAVVQEVEIGTKAGNGLTLEVNASALRDSGGKAYGVVSTFRDVTGRKQTQAALRGSRDFYLTLLESFPGLIWRTGPDGKGTYFNRNWLEFTGRTAEDQSGDGWLEIIHERDRGQLVRAQKEAFDERKAFESEFRMRRNDGTFRWMMVSGQPFRDMDGSFAGYIGFAYDITERKAASTEIERRNRELRLLNAISSGISHARDLPGMLYGVLADAMCLAQVRSGAIYLADSARSGQMKLHAMLPDPKPGTPELFKPAFIPAVRVDTGKVYATDAGTAGCIAAAAGNGAVLVVPISWKSRPVGLMAFCADTTDEIHHVWESEQTTAQLLSIGSQLGIAIESQTLPGNARDANGIMDRSPDAGEADHFRQGVIYLMDKSRTDRHMDIFADQVKHDIRGLCITRQNPQTVRDRYGLEKTPVIWLNGGDIASGNATSGYAAGGDVAIKAGNIASLTATISDFVARSEDGAIMLDGMEYLMARNGFESMLKFVQFLNDRIMTSNSRAFFCIDTGALDDKQKHLLLTEMKEFREQA